MKRGVYNKNVSMVVCCCGDMCHHTAMNREEIYFGIQKYICSSMTRRTNRQHSGAAGLGFSM